MSNYDYTNISLNASNLEQNGYNNKYTVQFPGGFLVDNNTTIAIQSVALYNSWFNISASLGNNRIDLIFPSTTLNITIPDGYYSPDTLNQYLQTVMISNNLYMTDNNNNNVFYIELIQNATYYSLQFNFYTIPNSIPSGYTSHFSSLPSSATTPQVRIYDKFSTYCGISAGTYPSDTTTASYKLSNTTPQVDTVQSLIMTCDAVNNQLASIPSFIYSMPVNASQGALITSQPNEYLFMRLKTGSMPRLSIEILDQNYNKIQMKDTNVLISFVIRRQI